MTETVTRVKQQSDDFTVFVESAATRLRRTAFLMCRDWHLAQDLTQHTLTKMYTAWNRIRTGTNLDAYSRRVLMNLVFDQQARRKGSEVVLTEIPDQRSPDDKPELRLARSSTLSRASASTRARDRKSVV